MAPEYTPRQAEPGQHITYTVPVEHRIVPEGEDVPEGVRTVKGETIGRDGAYADRDYMVLEGVQRTLTADGQGVIVPETDDDVKVLDSFGLPNATDASSARAEAKAAKAAEAAQEAKATKEGD